MAQPKIIASLSKLEQAGFIDGSVYLGDLRTTTCLDSIMSNGLYLFTGGTTTPTDTTGSYLWCLSIYSSKDKGTNIIQVAERFNTASDSKRLLFSRQYNSSTWSAWFEGGGGGSIECDTATSTTSENPLQNKVITAALAKKSDTGHTHSQYATTTALNNKLDKSGGTLTGQLVAQANTNYTTYQVRNIALNTTAATPTGNGSILGVYTA